MRRLLLQRVTGFWLAPRHWIKIYAVAALAAVGKLVAERAVAAGIKAVAFDRSGFKYHGRVKALADAAREAGLEF